MRGGNMMLLASAALVATGCTTDEGKLNLRPIADPLSAAAKRGSPMLAEGRGALALGNVGTALEAFRKALRQQPDSVEALAGIAACYERMGRYDLSRVNYEAALAIAPNNPILLNSFAASLQSQGRMA
jgi:Flp pilus assembly protein TadD